VSGRRQYLFPKRLAELPEIVVSDESMTVHEENIPMHL